MAGLMGGVAAVEALLEAFRRVQSARRLVRPSLDRCQVHHHQVLDPRGFAVAADGRRVSGPPHPDATRRRPCWRRPTFLQKSTLPTAGQGVIPRSAGRYHPGLLAVEHAMLPHRVLQVLAVQIPACEVQVAVGRNPGSAHAGKRQARHVVRAGAQHLDARCGRGGDGAAEANDKHANTRRPVVDTSSPVSGIRISLLVEGRTRNGGLVVERRT